mgnify:CR=1 FL=1
MATKAVAKKPGTAVTLWEKKMADAAERQKQTEKPMAGFLQITTGSGILSVDGNEVKDNFLDVVVLQSAYENAYYGGEPYDAANPKPPVCYAFGDIEADDPEEGMAPGMYAGKPSAEVADKQADSCADCEHNVMGSSDTGKGKSCKNIRRLAVITSDSMESAEKVTTAEVRLVKVPVTSVKNWSGYVRNTLTDDLNRPYWSVVSRLALARDKKTQFKMTFDYQESIDFDDGTFVALEKQIEKVKKLIVAPYPTPDAEEAPAKPRGKVATKAVAGKGKKY